VRAASVDLFPWNFRSAFPHCNVQINRRSAPSGWNKVTLRPPSFQNWCEITSNVPRCTTAVTTRPTKQNTPNTYCLNRVLTTLNLGLFLVPSMTACLLLLSEILTSRSLTCLNRWKTAVSLNTILALESLFVVFKF
jgi:hypothetical protein